jgi:hypothetical protein
MGLSSSSTVPIALLVQILWPLKMFRSAVDKLFEIHRERMLNVCAPETVDDAFEALEVASLTTFDIDMACMDELKTVLCKRHDMPIETSSRLNKYGWSNKRIEEHMSRFLETKMKAAGRLLSSFVRPFEKTEAALLPRATQDSDSADEDIPMYRLIGHNNRMAATLDDLTS